MREYPAVSIDRFDHDNLLARAYFLSHCHKGEHRPSPWQPDTLPVPPPTPPSHALMAVPCLHRPHEGAAGARPEEEDGGQVWG